MAWVDFRKAYDMVPHSWVIKCLKMFGIADNVIDIIASSMSMWKTNLYANQQHLGSVNIRRGIFQGDSLSPLLFVNCLIPISLILRNADAAYALEKNGPKLNHLFFMDDLKLYASNEAQIESLITTVFYCCKDIGMEFGIKKWRVKP